MAKAKKTKKGTKTKKTRRLSNVNKPKDFDIRKWQIELRKKFAEKQEYQLENIGGHKLYSDFIITSPEHKNQYHVSIRSKDIGRNFCSCPDFKTNTLGTCKHIEWTFHKLKNTYGLKKHFRLPPPERSYTSIYLNYAEELKVRIRIGTDHKEAFAKLTDQYFDDKGCLFPHAFLDFDKLLKKAKAISDDFRCYDDVLDYILQQRADEKRRKHFEKFSVSSEKKLAKVLKTKLFPYQQKGVLFAAAAGRSLIADEMGLGKTIQALATAELMRQEKFISKALIICPTSLKYQWKAEIEKFTKSTVHVVEGNPLKRAKIYKEDESMYLIMTYNVVSRDIDRLNEIGADMVILDEAQRIKNWNTKISRAVKKLTPQYCVVLTGTPLENKLEELYSIVQFVDPYKLNPLFSFLDRHQVKAEHGQIVGYKNLNDIHNKLKDVMIRRRKKQVLREMPRRLDKVLYVPMTETQWQIHSEYGDQVAQIVAKWRRFGFLNEKDRRYLMVFLNMMRMSCNSSFLIDQQTRHDTKIDELMYILEERLAEPGEKVVIFSQWERMTRLVAMELEERNIPFANLHGGIHSKNRGELLERFRDDEECVVFLSTDAGGVGLNLQAASMVINLDIPWNPAVLEQRIARVYRMGQKKPVQVINFVSTGTIEHRMLDVLQFKAGLAAGVLDAAEDSIFMSDKKHEKFMESVERITEAFDKGESLEVVIADSDKEEEVQEAPGAARSPEPVEPTPVESFEEDIPALESKPIHPTPRSTPIPSTANSGDGNTINPGNPQELLSMGMSFIGRLSKTLSDPTATKDLIDTITEQDQNTGQSYLKIPVESKEVVQNVVQLFGSLFSQMGK